MTGNVVWRIERFRFPGGAVVAECRNCVYALRHAVPGALVAILHTTKRSSSAEILHWSAWKER